MKVNILLLFLFCFYATFLSITNVSSQEKSAKRTEKFEKTKIISDKILLEEKKLDKEIIDLNKKIKNVIINYKLLETKNIRVLPYRTTYNLGDNFIEIEKYDLQRDTLYDDRIIGIHKRRIKIFINGDSISKIESLLTEHIVGLGFTDSVTVIDPSPITPGTDDIIFTQIKKNIKIIDNKKLSEVKNNRVSPLRNIIKKEFILPNNNFLYNTILNIAETYYQGVKDTDSMLTDFLKRSTVY